MLKQHQKRIVFPAFIVLIACLLGLPPLAAQAALPSTLESAQFDWVCVTDAALVDAYAPLAAYREDQGLASLVVSMSEAMLWSPAGDDSTATLRWLAGVAHEQWGARYFLLGGSHALLPAPLHRLVVGDNDFDHPIDSYYACLDGEWDVDGDGLFAEWEEDAADPTIHLRVGRVPADSPETVANVVAKILAFENRAPATTGGALFVSSWMIPNWNPDVHPYPPQAIRLMQSISDTARAHDPSLRIGTIYQGPEVVPPDEDPLNEAALVDSLGARAHDFVFYQLHGDAPIWELVFPRIVTAASFAPLSGVGHSSLLVMISGSVGDTRAECVLQELLTLPDGGVVAAIAPTGVGFISPLYEIQRFLWPHLTDRLHERYGDAHVAALQQFDEEVGLINYARAKSYWYQGLLGDPATLIRTATTPPTHTPSATPPLRVRATPNPFNPGTEISFAVAADAGGTQPVTVEIFDLQGRRVETLLKRALPPGPHAVTWHAAEASGLYFARVSVADQKATIKLILVE